jgi:hypothetical protein
MLELLEWGKKGGEEAAGPGSDPNAAGTALAGPSGAAASALDGLSAQLGAAEGAAAEPKARIAALARIQDSGAPHVSALLTQYLVNAAGTQAAREAAWTSLANYQARLAQALCALAGAQLTLLSAARALQALRTLAKLHLVHYAGVPAKLWRVAYAIHAGTENAGYSTTPVHAQSGRQTTVELEFLRLLMLRASAPDMMAPEQIEVADRVVEQLGAEFTLRQPGVADNPFCFEPESESPPQRAQGRPPSGTARYFGPGLGYGSLERIARQLGAGKLEDFKAFGKDLAPGAQLSAVQHLLAFWRVDCPYAPPAYTPAAGTLQVVHGYHHVWQYLSESRQGVRELSLADSPAAAPQPPETWELRGAGGNELGAQVPQASRVWAKCGAVVGLSMRDGERWIGVIRRMHALPDGGLQADVAVLSRAPQARSLHEMAEMGEERAVSDAASRAFAFAGVNAVIVADGADGAQPANMMLPANNWKEGRIYELQAQDESRYLRGLQAVRRGDDFVRATFEWVSAPDELPQL